MTVAASSECPTTSPTPMSTSVAGAQGGVEVPADLGVPGGGDIADDDLHAGQRGKPVRLGQEAVLQGEGDMPLRLVHQQRLGGERGGLGEPRRGRAARGVPHCAVGRLRARRGWSRQCPAPARWYRV